MMTYADLQKLLLKAKVGQVSDIFVPKQRYLCVEGQGEPGSDAYAQAIGQLYAAAYTVKFMPKAGVTIPDYEAGYPIGALEGIYYPPIGDWRWTMMLPQPMFVTPAVLRKAATLAQKKNKSIDLVELKWIELGRCVQTLHVGPYDQEQPAIDLLHAYLSEHTAVAKAHHEVYLNNPGQVSPDKLKTIIRFPY